MLIELFLRNIKLHPKLSLFYLSYKITVLMHFKHSLGSALDSNQQEII